MQRDKSHCPVLSLSGKLPSIYALYPSYYLISSAITQEDKISPKKSLSKLWLTEETLRLSFVKKRHKNSSGEEP
jgi:hypothetical protein